MHGLLMHYANCNESLCVENSIICYLESFYNWILGYSLTQYWSLLLARITWVFFYVPGTRSNSSKFLQVRKERLKMHDSHALLRVYREYFILATRDQRQIWRIINFLGCTRFTRRTPERGRKIPCSWESRGPFILLRSFFTVKRQLLTNRGP